MAGDTWGNIAYSTTLGTVVWLDTTMTATNWAFSGAADYGERFNGDEYIKVDKGAPDTGKFVIFYAIIDEGDPMIFCDSKAEVSREVKKLLKRKDVDNDSIRIFGLVGGAKKE